MIHFKGSTLQQSADYGQQLSSWFGKHILKDPHELAFEKVLWPCAFYRKKLYAAAKWEDSFGPDAKPSMFARGISAIRRDNAKLVSDTVKEVMDMMFFKKASREAIIDFCGKSMANILNSATMAYSETNWDNKLPFEAFIQSAGIGKDIAAYKTPNNAFAIAQQMLAENHQCGIGKGSRVTFVIARSLPGSKRSDTVLLPHVAQELRVPLDPTYYTDALLAKLAPLVCVLYMNDDRASRRAVDVFGNIVTIQPKLASERDRLLGESIAERAIVASFKKQKWMQTTEFMSTSRVKNVEPKVAPVALKPAPATQSNKRVAKETTEEPEAKKAKVSKQQDISYFFRA